LAKCTKTFHLINQIYEPFLQFIKWAQTGLKQYFRIFKTKNWFIYPGKGKSGLWSHWNLWCIKGERPEYSAGHWYKILQGKR